jgi:hypothetical protein
MLPETSQLPEPGPLGVLLEALPREHVKEASPLGLILSPGLNLENWSRLVASLVQLTGRASRNRDTLTAWLGDLLAFGGGKYRGQISEYAKAAGLDPGTLRGAKLVCSRIPLLCRHNTLSWSHHCEVGKAFKDPADIKSWLELAVSEKLSVRDLRKRIRVHVAGPTSPDSGPAKAGEAAPFALLRELRAVGRFVKNHSEVWQEWSPAACELALSEMQPIADFLEAMKARRSPRQGWAASPFAKASANKLPDRSVDTRPKGNEAQRLTSNYHETHRKPFDSSRASPRECGEKHDSGRPRRLA